MSADDENRFRPKPGRIRSDVRPGKTKSFFSQAKKIARQHSASPSRSSPRSGRSPTGKGGKAARSIKGPGLQRGRGAAFVRARALSGGWRHSAPGMRRVVVKTRYVQSAGRNGKSAAHLRYIQRDGTSRDGERGQLYSATEDRAELRCAAGLPLYCILWRADSDPILAVQNSLAFVSDPDLPASAQSIGIASGASGG